MKNWPKIATVLPLLIETKGGNVTGLHQCTQKGNQSEIRNTTDFFQNISFYQKQAFKQ